MAVIGAEVMAILQRFKEGNFQKGISSQKCAVLHICNVEADHKDGNRDDYENLKTDIKKFNQEIFKIKMTMGNKYIII